MAQAIKHLFPQAKFWVGPVVAEGFYYDVDLGDDVIRDEDITAIEKEMKKIAKSGKKIIRKEISKEEAMEMFKNYTSFPIWKMVQFPATSRVISQTSAVDRT